MSQSRRWKLRVDTGGTFTDCLAVTPSGDQLRAKVLSSSAIRGLVTSHSAPDTLGIDCSQALPDQFFDGQEFVLLNRSLPETFVTSYNAANQEITLSRSIELPGELPAGFEVRCGVEAPVLAAHLVTETPLNQPLPSMDMRLATTKGTNALLEQKGAATALLITEGFEDLLLIGNQQRPDLFSLKIDKPAPLWQQVIGIPERLDSTGQVIKPLDMTRVNDLLDTLDPGIESIAICLMNSYRNRVHEESLCKALKKRGYEFISTSDENALIKIVSRTRTAVVNAYLSPIMERYLQDVASAVSRESLTVMSSTGSLIASQLYKPRDGLLSGPAGGVTGAAAIGRRCGKRRLISFDMGGTSTDVARYDNGHDYLTEHQVGDALLQAPAIAIETVAAGGGSVCGFDGTALTVGPESAGAQPGPACYGAGGPLTITDVNLLTGRLDPSNFHFPVSVEAARKAFHEVYKAIVSASESIESENTVLEGFLDIANEKMAQTIKTISLQKGFDPADYTLVGFGGAGGQHATSVARKLGISSILIPADAGLLSAYGLDCSVREEIVTRQVLRPLKDLASELPELLDELEQEALATLGNPDIKKSDTDSTRKSTRESLRDSTLETDLASDPASGRIRASERDTGLNRDTGPIIRERSIFMRLTGQESSLEIPLPEVNAPQANGQGFSNENSQAEQSSSRQSLTAHLADLFEDAYRTSYGHWVDDRDLEITMIRVIASDPPPEIEKSELPDAADLPDAANLAPPTTPATPATPSTPASTRTLIHNGKTLETPVWHRQNLKSGNRLTGPALILDPFSTLLVEPGWQASVRTDQTIELSHYETEQIAPVPADADSTGLMRSKEPAGNSQYPVTETAQSDIVQLQLFTNRFTSLAEQMGEQLRRTALSVNIRERLDFSCALLDRDGNLVVNAPHIPVHLGAMGICVRTVASKVQMNEGDVFVTNHPGYGGSHLPDVTVITPIFHNGERVGFVANRAHHSEIGGKSPGSMPPDATTLIDEGVVIPPVRVVKSGTLDLSELRKRLTTAQWPTRSVEENIADLQASIAANHKGVTEFQVLLSHYGPSTVTQYMYKLKQHAAKRMRETLSAIEDGNYQATELMDDGSRLTVSCDVSGDQLSIDFSGSSDTHPGNLNANPAIVNSVLIYVLRLLVDEPLPLNDGLLDPVTIHIPKGILNPDFPDDPAECPAVVGGNIETSQRLTDTLIKAFELSACSQGTMNNILFGNESFGYYETVAGGTGAGDGFDGADAVHHHMTNTLATDPEILEQRYPVRLDRYAIRRGSGGSGRWQGGNGIVREMTFLEPVQLSVLTQHRVTPPFGMKGGSAGATGAQWIERMATKPENKQIEHEEKRSVESISKKNRAEDWNERNSRADDYRQQLNWRDGADVAPGDRLILHTPGGGGYGEY